MTRLEKAIQKRLDETDESDLYPACQQQMGSDPILQLRMAAALGAGVCGEELLDMFYADLDSSNVERVGDDGEHRS